MRFYLIAGLLLSLTLSVLADTEFEEKQPSPFVFEASYVTDALVNLAGGRSRGSVLMGSLLLDFRLDGEEAMEWDGASFEASVLGIHGGPFSAKVGDFQTVSSIEAPRTVRLFRAYYEQRFWEDRLSLVLGLFNIDHEFDTRETADVFVHSSPGTGGDIGQLGRNGPGIFPVGALGGRVRFEDEGWYAQAAVVEGTPGDPDNPFGTTLRIDRDEGFFVIGESGRVWSDEAGQLGKVGLGAWGFTAPFETHLDPNARASNNGVYLTLEKTLYREKDAPEQGMSAFLRTGVADGRINPIATFVGAGLVYTGPFQGRDRDRVGFSISSGFAGSEFIRAGPHDSHETDLELTYCFAVNDNLCIQPDLQYVVNPGFDPNLKNSFILGLRAVATFSTE